MASKKERARQRLEELLREAGKSRESVSGPRSATLWVTAGPALPMHTSLSASTHSWGAVCRGETLPGLRQGLYLPGAAGAAPAGCARRRQPPTCGGQRRNRARPLHPGRRTGSACWQQHATGRAPSQGGGSAGSSWVAAQRAAAGTAGPAPSSSRTGRQGGQCSGSAADHSAAAVDTALIPGGSAAGNAASTGEQSWRRHTGAGRTPCCAAAPCAQCARSSPALAGGSGVGAAKRPCWACGRKQAPCSCGAASACPRGSSGHRHPPGGSPLQRAPTPQEAAQPAEARLPAQQGAAGGGAMAGRAGRGGGCTAGHAGDAGVHGERASGVRCASASLL